MVASNRSGSFSSDVDGMVVTGTAKLDHCNLNEFIQRKVHGPGQIEPGAIKGPSTTEGMEQYPLVLMDRGDKWSPRSTAFEEGIKQYAALVSEMTEK